MGFIILLVPVLWWGITVVAPVFFHVKKSQPYAPWVIVCWQISAFTLVFGLLIGTPILALIISPPILGAVILYAISAGASGLTWLVLPAISAGFLSFFAIFITLRERQILPKFRLFIALVASAIIGSAVAELASRRAMHNSAQNLGGEIVKIRPVIRVIGDRFAGGHLSTHAFMRLDDNFYHWSYHSKAFIPPNR